MDKRLVLLVGDPQFSARLDFIAAFQEGFVLYWAKSLEQAEVLLENRRYDLIVVDTCAESGVVESFCRASRVRYPAMKVACLAGGCPKGMKDCIDLMLPVEVSQPDFIAKISRLFG